MNMDDDMGADGEGYYKAQLPEFFTGIHDPQGEYLSILNNYKLAAGMAPSTNLIDSSHENQGSMFPMSPAPPPPPPPPDRKSVV